MGSNVVSSGIGYSLSFFDLLQYPLFKMAAKQDDKELMKKIFYEAGMDINAEFEIVECLHRPVTSKQPWFGLRVQGDERVDYEWRTSGCASLESKLYTTDSSLSDELNSLDPRNHKHVKRDFEDEVECDVDIPEDSESDEVVDV